MFGGTAKPLKMGSAATLNPFSLLGDNENDDPIQLAAAAPKAPKKVAAAQEPKPSTSRSRPSQPVLRRGKSLPYCAAALPGTVTGTVPSAVVPNTAAYTSQDL